MGKKVSDEKIEVEKNKDSEVPEFQGFVLDTALMGLNSGGNCEHSLLCHPTRKKIEQACSDKQTSHNVFLNMEKKNISSRTKGITNRLKIEVHIKYTKCLGTNLVSNLCQKSKQTEVK